MPEPPAEPAMSGPPPSPPNAFGSGPTPPLWAAEACSRVADTRTAALEIADRLETLGIGPGAVILLFASFHHAAALREAIELLRRSTQPATLAGMMAAGIVAGGEEIEGRPAMTALALAFPGVHAEPVRISLDDGPFERWSPGAVASRLGFAADGTPPKAILLFADPFGHPADGALAALARLRPRGPAIPVFGGVASGSSQLGGNLLFVDGHLERSGIVGVALHGAIEADPLLSNAGRAIGRPLVITAAQGPAIKALGGRPALEAAREACEGLSEREQARLRDGLLLGIAAEESGDAPSRNASLLRPIAAAHLARGELLLAEPIRAGRLVRFHLRDPQTASEDLDLALDAAQLRPPPAAILACVSTARGAKLFGTPSHDASRIARRLGSVPMAGAFTAGEFAPLERASHTHGLAVAAALLRPAPGPSGVPPAPPPFAG